MKHSKLLLAVAGATVLLGALVASASAGKFERSSQIDTILWRSLSFSGGFEIVACEVKLSGSLHTRTATKTVNSLIGYITEGTVLRCPRFSATINQASLPWHRSFRNFAGALPNITAQSEAITGAEWRFREPVFGITCTIRREESGSMIDTYAVSGGAISRAEVSSSGTRCEGALGTFSGTETNVTNGASARITVRLI